MSKFVEVINSTTEPYPKLRKTINNSLKNIIFYGPENSGKYIQSLHFLKTLSPSGLSYNKKMTVTYDSDDYIFRLSDVHVEINFEFLGCVAKNLWIEIYNQILAIANKRQFYIVCNHFCNVNNDLLEIFYTYMNSQANHIHFIFLTRNISLLPSHFVDQCIVFPMKKLPASRFNNYTIENNFSEQIADQIINYKTLEIKTLRNTLYNCLTYQCDIHEILYRVFRKVLRNKTISIEKQNKLLNSFNNNLKLFNNNYRSIYHLEKNVFTIISIFYNE